MAAPGLPSVEEIEEVKKKIKKKEEEEEETKKEVEEAKQKVKKLKEGRTEAEYIRDPRYTRAQKDLASKEKILAGTQRILAELLKIENLLRSQGGAGQGTSSAADSVGLDVLLLQTGLAAAVYPSQLSRSGTTTPHAASPSEVHDWIEFSSDAVAWGADVGRKLASQSVSASQLTRFANLGPMVFSEVDICKVVDEELGRPLYLLAKGGAFDGPIVQLVLAKLDKGAPDRCVVAEDGTPLVVMEIKHRYALSSEWFHPLDYKPNGKSSANKHIEQLCGYMFHNGIIYGVLCSDAQFWFAKLVSLCAADEAQAGGPAPGAWPAPVRLYITKAPIQGSETQPSVITALMYITHLALQQRGSGPRAGQQSSTPRGPATSHNPQGASDQITRAALAGAAARRLQLLCLKLTARLGPLGPVVVTAKELELGTCLGRGLTGRVYSGVLHGVLPIAIKVPARGMSKEQGKSALSHEVAVYSRLQPLQGRAVPRLLAHGTLVTDVGDELPFLATELVVGGVAMDAAALSLDAASASAVKEQACCALQAVHSLGVAHGDVRGPNLLVTARGSFTLIDFGQAVLDPDQVAMDRDLRDLSCLLADSGWWPPVPQSSAVLAEASHPSQQLSGNSASTTHWAAGMGEAEAVEAVAASGALPLPMSAPAPGGYVPEAGFGSFTVASGQGERELGCGVKHQGEVGGGSWGPAGKGGNSAWGPDTRAFCMLPPHLRTGASPPLVSAARPLLAPAPAPGRLASWGAVPRTRPASTQPRRLQLRI